METSGVSMEAKARWGLRTVRAHSHAITGGEECRKRSIAAHLCDVLAARALLAALDALLAAR